MSRCACGLVLFSTLARVSSSYRVLWCKKIKGKLETVRATKVWLISIDDF